MQLPLILPKETVVPMSAANDRQLENVTTQISEPNQYIPLSSTPTRHQELIPNNLSIQQTSQNNQSVASAELNQTFNIPVLNNTTYRIQEPGGKTNLPTHYPLLQQPPVSFPVSYSSGENNKYKKEDRYERTETVGSSQNLANKVQSTKQESKECNTTIARKRSKQSQNVNDKQKKRRVKIEISETATDSNSKIETHLNKVVGQMKIDCTKGNSDRMLEIKAKNAKKTTKTTNQDHVNSHTNEPHKAYTIENRSTDTKSEKSHTTFKISMKKEAPNETASNIDVLGETKPNLEKIADKNNRKFEPVTTLSKFKLHAIKDHHLLNTPLTLQEASKLIYSDRVDPYFKEELTHRVNQKHMVGAEPKNLTYVINKQNAAKQTGCGDWQDIQIGDNVNTEHVISGQNTQSSLLTETNKGPKAQMEPVIRIGKLQGINEGNVVRLIPTGNDGKVKFSGGLKETDIANNKLFYIVSNGKNSKSKSNNSATEVMKKTDASKSVNAVSNNQVTREEKSHSSASPKPFKLNGLIVASPKPITQEIYKQLQANVNIVKSLKAPISRGTNTHVPNPVIINTSKVNRVSLVNENNNRVPITNNNVYNSKLTVAQLLKNKRGEDQLECLLKSKLNMSSNAINNNNNQKTDSCSKDIASGVNDNKSKSTDINDKNKYESTNTKSQTNNSEIDKTVSIDTLNIKTVVTSNSVNSQERDVITTDGPHVSQSVTENVNNRTTVHKLNNKNRNTTKNADDQNQEMKQNSFSIRVGGKMVVMRKAQVTPEKREKGRKKLPPPKPRNQYELSVRQETVKLLKNKLKQATHDPKGVLVEKLQLMPTSKLVKKLKTASRTHQHQYSLNVQGLSLSGFAETQKQINGTISTADSPGLADTKEIHFQDTWAPVLQIHKEYDDTYTHDLQIAKLEKVSRGTAMFRRWFEYSDYPCLIHFTGHQKISRIQSESFKQGFYLLTRTDNSQNIECSDSGHTLPVILSMYPADLALLPKSSTAIVIGTIFKDVKDKGIVMSQFDKNGSSLENLINHLLLTTNYCSLLHDSRYSSITDDTMSPRICSPMFYSMKLQSYFSSMDSSESNKPHTGAKESHRLSDKRSLKGKSVPKLPTCSSKVAALKKKQNALLKTCQRIKKARHLNCEDKSGNNGLVVAVNEKTNDTLEVKSDNERINEDDYTSSDVLETKEKSTVKSEQSNDLKCTSTVGFETEVVKKDIESENAYDEDTVTVD